MFCSSRTSFNTRLQLLIFPGITMMKIGALLTEAEDALDQLEGNKGNSQKSTIHVFVQTPVAKPSYVVFPQDLVSTLKKLISLDQKIPASQQDLFFDDVLLDDSCTFAAYGIRSKTTLCLQRKK